MERILYMKNKLKWIHPALKNYHHSDRAGWVACSCIQKGARKMRLIDAMRQNDTFTENLMPTHSTSLDRCVDLFAGIGSARNWSKDEIESAFVRAFEQEPLIAMKILFWARDVRGGAGERHVFRVITEYMDCNPNYDWVLYKNIGLIPEYGRWDDLFKLNEEYVLDIIKHALLEHKNGLLAKWLPRKGEFANKVRRYLDMTPKAYRKLIVGLSNTVEQKMCAKEWEGITYEHVPSVAMNKYRKAFKRNDEQRFSDFINAVVKGETSIKAGTLFPYQLYQAYKRRENEKAIEAQWMNLPNYMEGNPHRILPMCDTSGSMTTNYGGFNTNLVPMDISVSLGIYISERNEGIFKDAFLTFSRKPQMQYLKGSFTARCKQLEKAHWEMNTNLEAAFNLLLRKGLEFNISQKNMPNMILIISDMQFDRCVRQPNSNALQMIKNQYEASGYEFPKVIFWNVNARVGKMPVSYKDENTGIVSGCSPAILTAILSGDSLTPRDLMLRTINVPRYEAITV